MSSIVSRQSAWQRAQIMSVVTVVDRGSDPARAGNALRLLHAEMTELRLPFEIVVMVNGGTADLLEALHRLAVDLTDLQFYALQYPVDATTARVAGLENAVGDWVATFALEADRAADLSALFAAVLRDGAEVGLPKPRRLRPRGPFFARLASMLFHRLFRSIHGFSLAELTPSLRLLSRSVINAMLQHNSPLVAFETLTATGGYRTTRVPTDAAPEHVAPFAERVRSRWRVLIGLNAVPLRLANALCGLGAFVAALYSLYVVLVYLYKQDVMPGWTTMSLMLSCIFFLMSLVLGLLSEYMIMMFDSGSRRPRYFTANEFASHRQARNQSLNIETDT